MIDLKALAEGASLLAIAKDAGKKIVSPLADEIGKALGTFGEIFRFYQNENLGKVFTKWDAAREHKHLNEGDLKRVVPLLQQASVQSDDELQDRWAALLEATVSMPEGVLPSFGQTLSQLTADEAQFLDRLYEFATQPRAYLSEHRPGAEPFDHVNLINIYDPSINTGTNAAEREFFKDKLSVEQVKNYDMLTQAELVIQDLIRLGILMETQIGEVDHYIPSSDGIGPAGPFSRSPVNMETRYSLSLYGLAFIRAVAP
jgi:hypothetical protein